MELLTEANTRRGQARTLKGDTFAPPLHSKASTMRPTSASMSLRCASRCRSAISIRNLCVSRAASILLSSARRNPSPMALRATTTSLTPSSSPSSSSRRLFLGGEAGGEGGDGGETAGGGDGDRDGDRDLEKKGGEGPSRRSMASRRGQGRRRLDRRRRRSFSTLWRHCLAVFDGAAMATAAQSAEVRCSRPTARRRAV